MEGLNLSLLGAGGERLPAWTANLAGVNQYAEITEWQPADAPVAETRGDGDAVGGDAATEEE